MLLANLAPGGGAAATAVADPQRLHEIRETLERRAAEQRHIEEQIDVLADRVVGLQERRERASRDLDAGLAEVARLEQELDRLVPRLLISERRKVDRERSSARTVASIVTLSRASMAPEMRARLRAISPIMLRRLSTRGSGFDLLEARAERLIERHRHLRDRLPAVMAAGLSLEMERDQAARRQNAVQQRLQETAADLERLARAEAVMAREVLRAEQARAALVSVTPERARHAPLLRATSVRFLPNAGLQKPRLGRGLPSAAWPAHAADPARVRPAMIDASVRTAAVRPGPGPALRQPPPAKPTELVERAQILAPSDHVANGSGRSVFSASLEQLPEFRRPSRPIMPAPDTLLDPVLQAVDQRPVITMPAVPGQEVAAPDAGRVAFSGGFGSYGLLLILEHERDYHTILWGFSELTVATGESVEAGDIVGVMGGEGSSELRVEFRRNGRPVGILPWLAASSSKVRG